MCVLLWLCGSGPAPGWQRTVMSRSQDDLNGRGSVLKYGFTPRLALSPDIYSHARLSL